jgi:4-amino-4-deoxychorismate lyase
MPPKDLLNSYKNKILKKSSESELDSGVLKIIITRGVGGRGYKYESNLKPTIIFLSFPAKTIDQKLYNTGVKVKLCETDILQNKRISGIKHLNRLDSVIARSEWDNNFFEGLFVDKSGNLLEGTMTNIFFIKNKVLYIPKLKSFGIEGIMSQVIKEKKNLFFKDFMERNLKFSEINNFDAMFLTNSIIRVLPVKNLENVSFTITDELKNLVEYFSTSSKIKNNNLELL